jgi:hypothetical protein
MSKPIVPEWPGHGRGRGEAGSVDASAFRVVVERLRALQGTDASERQGLNFLAALCRAHAEGVIDARGQGFMRRPLVLTLRRARSSWDRRRFLSEDETTRAVGLQEWQAAYSATDGGRGVGAGRAGA